MTCFAYKRSTLLFQYSFVNGHHVIIIIEWTEASLRH